MEKHLEKWKTAQSAQAARTGRFSLNGHRSRPVPTSLCTNCVKCASCICCTGRHIKPSQWPKVLWGACIHKHGKAKRVQNTYPAINCNVKTEWSDRAVRFSLSEDRSKPVQTSLWTNCIRLICHNYSTFTCPSCNDTVFQYPGNLRESSLQRVE